MRGLTVSAEIFIIAMIAEIFRKSLSMSIPGNPWFTLAALIDCKNELGIFVKQWQDNPSVTLKPPIFRPELATALRDKVIVHIQGDRWR